MTLPSSRNRYPARVLKVEIPLSENLDLSEPIEDWTTLKYRLLAAVYHCCTIDNGHYIMVAKGSGLETPDLISLEAPYLTTSQSTHSLTQLHSCLRWTRTPDYQSEKLMLLSRCLIRRQTRCSPPRMSLMIKPHL